jgi:hypothetical protein
MYKVPSPLSLEDVNVCAGYKVLMDVDDISALIVGNPQGVLGNQLRPHTIHQLNIIIIMLINHYIIYLNYIIKLTTIQPKGRSLPKKST